MGEIDGGTFLTNLEARPSSLDSKETSSLKDCKNLLIASLDVDPDPEISKTEDILFGVATELGRLEAAFSSFAHFIGQSNASLLAVVPPSNDAEVRGQKLRKRGLDVTLIASDLPFTQRYFHLVPELQAHIKSSRPSTKWVVLIDDDTFFSSVHQIGYRLSTLDHRKPQYIGGLSEAEWQLNHFGWMGFGGAGVFLSGALLDILDANYDVCAGEEIGGLDMPGDGRLAQCIYMVAPDVFVTPWNELRQWDIRGNADGIFESGREIWSYHHWADSGWLKTDVVKMSAVSLVAGEKSILRRWIFDRIGSKKEEKREYFVLNNGYSIAHYSLEPGVEEINFDETEFTWSQEAPGYEDALGPFRPIPQKMVGVMKKTWWLRDAIRLGYNIHQIYQRVDDDQEDVIELVWLGQ
ncbi:hypothetical protein UCRPC4_g03401 [Phaeomoniella chlamydospora]|uniref:Fringe-like glycosyltransferase domain-containing protein n=1 Tax=Phaeomoniella chlamydospora TaxID=158046 RepID=A0A0G2GZG1_PHACM|nr:hypothetical protein UCRPC4_g03401 [Phaeomoniella chlamydospora]